MFLQGALKIFCSDFTYGIRNIGIEALLKRTINFKNNDYLGVSKRYIFNF